MVSQNTSTVHACIERARKILLHEQRTNHQDRAIRPGGLEVFASIWAEEISQACNDAGLDLAPIHHFMEYIEGYRKQDPLQRARSLRAALGVLSEMEHNGQSHSPISNSTRNPQSTVPSSTPAKQPPVASQVK